MSRTYKRESRLFKKIRVKDYGRDSKSQVEEFLAEYEKKNQNPYIKLRSI